MSSPSSHRATARVTVVTALAAAAMATVLSGSACTKVSTGGPLSSRAVPGVVRIVGIGSMDNMVPELSATIAAVDVGMFWAGWFFIVNDKGQLEPDLATEVPTPSNGGISKDGLTIRYHLRRGVTWHDGVAFTARDAIFTWRLIMNPNNNVLSRTGYDQVASMDAPDPYTLVVHLKRPYSPVIAALFSMSGTPMCVLPEHLLRGLPDINHAAFNNKPVGTGPFMVAHYDPQSGVDLIANPHYWRGPPKLHDIHIIFAQDDSTRIVMMRTGEADLFYDPANRVVPELAGIPDTRALHTPFEEFWYLDFNLKRPPLDDLRLRRAIVMAVDRQSIIRDLLHGYATIANGDQPPFSWAHDPSTEAPSYDPVGAARLLDQAGWELGADGVRRRNGRPLTLVYAYSVNSGDGVRYGPIFQNVMRQLGIVVSVKGYPDSLFYAAKQSGGILQNGKFDVSYQGWIGGIDPDDRTLWACDQQPPSGYNTSFLCDRRVDEQERIAMTSYDLKTRKAAYARIQELLNADLPVDFLYWSMRNDSVRSELRNYQPAPVVTEFWNSWKWSI